MARVAHLPMRLSPPPRTERWQGRLRPALALIGVLVAVVGLAGSVGNDPRAPAATVTTAVVAVETVTGTVELSGTLEPQRMMRVAAGLPFRVTTVLVDVGDRVIRGQPLVKLDNFEQRARAAEAEAQVVASEAKVRQSEVRVARVIRAFSDEPPIPGDDLTYLDDVELAAVAVEADLVHAMAVQTRSDAAVMLTRGRLARTVLRSPLDGVVLSRHVEAGDLLAAGSAAVVVGTPLDHLRLVLLVGEKDVSRVRPGTVTLNVAPLPTRHFPAEVRQVAFMPEALRSPAQYRVILEVPNLDLALRPGMSATVKLPLVVVVPDVGSM